MRPGVSHASELSETFDHLTAPRCFEWIAVATQE
jgi:hypothetical protein